MLLQVFHLSVVALNCFTIWYDQMYIDLPSPSKEIEKLPFKARQLFLTIWCLVLQTLYFAVSLLNDVAGSNAISPKKPPLIRRAKDILFSIAFPVAIYVSLVFWSLYYANKELIFPDEVEKQFPVWVNHVMHTVIVPLIFIELLATKRNYPTRRLGVKIVVAFIWTYAFWVLGVYLKTGIWAYPFLAVMNWPLKFVFCVVSTIGGLGIYVMGEKINYAVSAKPKVQVNGVNGKTKNK